MSYIQLASMSEPCSIVPLTVNRSRKHIGVRAVLVLLLYALSSGPVLATAFWLGDATGIHAFNKVMWIYAPVLMLPRALWDPYISWWVGMVGTVGPG